MSSFPAPSPRDIRQSESLASQTPKEEKKTIAPATFRRKNFSAVAFEQAKRRLRRVSEFYAARNYSFRYEVMQMESITERKGRKVSHQISPLMRGQTEALLFLNICLPYIHSPKPSQRPDFNMCAELFKARAQLFISLWYIWNVC